MSHHPFSHLNDEEFLRHAEGSIDSLTSTDLEIELIRRFAGTVHNTDLQEANTSLEEAEREVETLTARVDELENALTSIKNTIEEKEL